jgi:hypothetical protein
LPPLPERQDLFAGLKMNVLPFRQRKCRAFVSAGCGYALPAVMKILPFGQTDKQFIAQNNSTSKKDVAFMSKVWKYRKYQIILHPKIIERWKQSK